MVDAKQPGDPKVCIKCPPLKKVGMEYIGKKVSEVRKMLGKELEVPGGAPAVISHDCGKTFKNTDEDYILQEWDVLEFGRTSAVKGQHLCEFGEGCPHCS